MNTSHLRVVTHMCGFLVWLYSLSMLPPMLIALIYKERSFFVFLETFLVFFSLGGIAWLATKKAGIQLRTRDGFLIIVLFWILFSIISAFPLWIDDEFNLSFVDALFEGVSGITTTGATVISDVSTLPFAFLYYRAQLNFIGGLGVIVLAVAVLPLLGIGGAKLYQSEMPGPFKDDKLTPRLADTSRTLWLTYLLLGIVCSASYFVAGMPLFDAICHGISTVSLGGFSTHSESIGFYNSHAIEFVAGLFSLLSAINFTLWYVVIVKRQFRPLLRNSELHFFLLVAFIVIAITAWQVWHVGMYDISSSIIHAFFLTSSMMTDNGLATLDYANWPSHTIIFLMLLSFFGGCIGSTCGGIKALRFLILFKQSRNELHQLAHPRALLSIKVDGNVVTDRVLRSVWSFFFLYILFTVFFICALNMMGYDLLTSFATVAACINNMGLGFGETASTFGTLNDAAKYLMCTAMILGRLEIYPVLILFSRFFWKS
ncbi:TrkH family potassium uptake protein [Escherichia fergusonii]